MPVAIAVMYKGARRSAPIALRNARASSAVNGLNSRRAFDGGVTTVATFRTTFPDLYGIGLYSIITATVTSFLIAGDGGKPDLAAQLERLSALHAEGRVTDDEYRMAKAVVLG